MRWPAVVSPGRRPYRVHFARDQLLALPKCNQCGKRKISHPEDTGQPCSMCRSGSRRCNCPKCGAPLIRNAKLPEVCAQCFKKA